MYYLFQQHRIGHRPVWRVAVLSILTASLYATFWTFQIMRELERCLRPGQQRNQPGARHDPFGVETTVWAAVAAAGTLACEVWTLGMCAATPWNDDPDAWVAWCSVGAVAWTITAWTIVTICVRIKSIASRTGATVVWSLPPVSSSFALLALALLVGGSGLYETGPLAPWDAVGHVMTTGLVLPLWVLWLQSALTDAVRPLGLQTRILEAAAPGAVPHRALRDRMRAAEMARVLPGPLDVRAARAQLPWVSLALTSTCCVVFLIELVVAGLDQTPQELLRLGAASVDTVLDGGWWRLATAQLLHAGTAHIAFNLFSLLLVGWYLERAVGHRITLGVMAAAAVGSAIASILLRLNAPEVVGVGVSGVVFGVFGAGVALDLRARSTVGRVSRWLTIIGVVSSADVEVDWAAHLGGFIGGWLVIYLYTRHSRGARPQVPPLPPVARQVPAPPPMPPPLRS